MPTANEPHQNVWRSFGLQNPTTEKENAMNPLILILNLYLAAHVAFWFLQETHRNRNSSAYTLLSRICTPFCHLFQNVEFRICGKEASIVVPVLALAMIRLFIAALS